MTLQQMAKSAAHAAQAIMDCDHQWKPTRPKRTSMPDGRAYLSYQCPSCGSVKLRGKGRRERAGGRVIV